MSIFERKLQSWENLAPDSTAGLILPLGMSYHGILIKLSASGVGATFTRAHILRVRAILNGKAFIRDIPASVLHRDNLFRGSRDDAAFLYLDFEEPRSKTLEGQYQTAIHTASGVNSFKLEMDISGAAVGTLKCETWALLANTGLPLAFVPAFIKESVYADVVGVKEVTPAFKVGAGGSGHIIRCIHFAPKVAGAEVAPSTVLGSLGITLRKSGIPTNDRMPDDANRFLQYHYEDVPITNMYTMDFVKDNNTDVHLLRTDDATDLVFEIDVSAESNWDIYYRMVTSIDRV